MFGLGAAFHGFGFLSLAGAFLAALAGNDRIRGRLGAAVTISA